MNDLKDLRRKIVLATLKSGEGHLPSAFSALEIIWTLYDQVLKPADAFILSKGHAALALYAVWEELGWIEPDELRSFATPGSRLGGHPDCVLLPDAQASSGSLGHGLAIGCGMALAKRIDDQGGRVYVLLGDGECQEGAVWEAARLATWFNLNVTCVVDCNGTHASNRELFSKFIAFGWKVIGEVDGHNPLAIEDALRVEHTGPWAVIFDTVKGKCCKSFEDDPGAWHHRAPQPGEELERILKEIEDG